MGGIAFWRALLRRDILAFLKKKGAARFRAPQLETQIARQENG